MKYFFVSHHLNKMHLVTISIMSICLSNGIWSATKWNHCIWSYQLSFYCLTDKAIVKLGQFAINPITTTTKTRWVWMFKFVTEKWLEYICRLLLNLLLLITSITNVFKTHTHTYTIISNSECLFNLSSIFAPHFKWDGLC